MTTTQVDLAIEGMTCASCVAHVTKSLDSVPGATASVNLPLESARVLLSSPVPDDVLIGAVRAAGYDGRVTRRRTLDDDGRDTGAGTASAAPAKVGTTGSETPGTSGSGTVASGDDTSDMGDMPGMDMPGMDMADDTSAPTRSRSQELLRRLRVSVVLAVPVVLLSMVPAWQFSGWQWVVAAAALPVATWGAWPFHRAAWRAGRHGATTMDTLVSIGVVAATAWSLWALLWGGAGEIGMRMSVTWLASGASHGHTPELYFEVATVVTVFLLAGRYAESRSRRTAGEALRALLALGADEALLVEHDPTGRRTTRTVPAATLQVGDEFMVRPGAKVATDGTVLEGRSAVDTSLLTGEPVPVDVAEGDPVTGATINTSGNLLVRATRVGDDTTLAAIGRLVSEAQMGKAPVQRLADRISAVFVPVVLGIAVVVLAVWLLAGASVASAFTAAVAVLIIACPCALGLATPTALLVGTGRAAQLGVLVSGPEVLESTRRVDTVVLDKTGTVTEGRMAVAAVVPAEGTDKAELLARAGAVEALSEHPIAQAVARAAAESGASRHARQFVSTPGGGVEALVDSGPGATASTGLGMGTRVVVGSPEWLGSTGIDVPTEAREALDRALATGATVVGVAWTGRWRGFLTLTDTVRPSSARAIADLRTLGLHPVLLTGDAAAPARWAADQVGIAPEDVVAQVRPGDKVAEVRRLQAAGKVVAMVGDGVNDAAALAQADLGMAMGTGTDAAIAASDITLVRADLETVGTAVRVSRRTLRVIQQNLFWAFAYNVAAIPLAALGLLNPMIAGATMAASSLVVVGNSLRLRRL